MRPRSRGRDQVPTHPLAGGILLTASLCGPEARAPASVVIETTRAHGARLRAARGWGGSASWSLRCRIAAMPRCGRAEDGSGMPRPDEGRPASPAAQDCSDAPLPLSAVRAHDAAPRRGETRFACGAGLQRCPAAAERCTGAACRAPTRLRAARGWGGSASWSLRRRIAAMPRPAEGRPASPAAQDCSNAPLPLSAVRARHAAPQHDSALRAAGAGAPAPDPTPPALIRKYGRSNAAPLPPGSSTTFSKDSGSRTQDSASRKQNISASEGRRPTENRS